MSKLPVTIVELGPEDLPITIEYIDEETGEEIRRDVIAEPGVLKVPGFAPRKVTVRTVWPDVTAIYTSSGAEVEEASDATGRP